jgi:hypothetical protein
MRWVYKCNKFNHPLQTPSNSHTPNTRDDIINTIVSNKVGLENHAEFNSMFIIKFSANHVVIR